MGDLYAPDAFSRSTNQGGMMGRSDAEQIEVPGTEREVDQQLENVIRLIKSKTEAATMAANEKRKAQDRGSALLREKDLDLYVSEKQGLTLRRSDKEAVKLEVWHPPKPSKAAAEA
jgi:hypothetical protein